MAMVYEAMEAWAKANLKGVVVTSAYRPGSRSSSGNLDYHSQGKAIDISGDPISMMAAFNTLAATFPNSLELIHSPAGSRQIWNGKPHLYTGAVVAQHYNHVHWAMESMTGGATIVNAGLTIPSPSDIVPEPIKQLGNAIAWLADVNHLMRILYALAGMALIIFALGRFTKVQQTIGKVI